MAMQNPLLDFSGLPRFDVIKPEHVTPAIDSLLTECSVVVAQQEKPAQQVIWDSFIEPLENATERLSRAWSAVGHLNAVVDTPELRAAYNENLPKVTEFWTALGQNFALFDKYKTLRASSEYQALSVPRKKIIDNALRDFRLGGAELPEAEKKRFAEIQEELAALGTRFSENVLDAINHYALFVETEAELAGMPEDAKLAARAAAENDQREVSAEANVSDANLKAKSAGRSQKDGKAGYKFTLHYPSFYPVLQYADNRTLRETLYRANVTKSSELGENPEWDNTRNIIAILKLRNEEAKLLGYKNFAEVSLVSKMADSPSQVTGFLDDLAVRAKPFAEKDLAELRNFAKNELGLDKLEAWDMAYASEKLREKRYAFSEEEVKQYFPEPRVIDGLFRLIQTLFSVDIKPDIAPVWHKDVKFFRIERNGKLIGQFYLDLYARNGKRSGAWMDDARGRRIVAGGVQTPLAHLICNFTEPTIRNGHVRPSFFTHDEVITLFHEFGHGLNHMLTTIDDLGVSGIAGVEWDAVELPSQFMENFCWEWDVLSHMTAHADSGAPLPRELFDKMIAAKNFQSGMQMLRQIEFGMCDMRLHDDYDPNGRVPFATVLDEVRERYSVVIPPSFNRFLQSFSHIFGGGYAAGYYSYKWAEVLSADAYAAFEEARDSGDDILSTVVGKKFQEEILAVGGARSALESFVAFRGREPKIDPLLRHNGMKS